MTNWKSLPLTLMTFIAFTCFLISCGEDRAAAENAIYSVDIEIISPTNNAIITIGENFNVEVDYARKENIIHNIKVEILDANGVQIMSLVERHAHIANEFTFKSDEVSIDQAGTYLVRASTTDLTDSDGGEHTDEEGSDNMVEHTIVVQ